eukprot:12655669-Prorocentrum_lima.AAC.1
MPQLPVQVAPGSGHLRQQPKQHLMRQLPASCIMHPSWTTGGACWLSSWLALQLALLSADTV